MKRAALANDPFGASKFSNAKQPLFITEKRLVATSMVERLSIDSDRETLQVFVS